MNVKNSHTLTTTTTGSKCSQKEANNQTDYQSHNDLGPPKVPSLQALGFARHTLSNQQAQVKHPETCQSNRPNTETVNLTENAANHTFKSPC